MGGYKTYFEARQRLMLEGAKPIDSADATSLRPGTHIVEIVNVEWDLRGDRVRGVASIESGLLRHELESLRVVFGNAGRFIECRPRPYGRLFNELRAATGWREGRAPSDILGRTVRLLVVTNPAEAEVLRATTGEYLVRRLSDGAVETYRSTAEALAKAREMNGADWTPTRVGRVLTDG